MQELDLPLPQSVFSVRAEILMMVTMMNTVFWDMMLPGRSLLMFRRDVLPPPPGLKNKPYFSNLSSGM
jgi:hypothetical protein